MDFLQTDSIVAYHRIMLADRVRTEAFRRAIMETVSPGDVVVDVGAGSGILSMFACQAGASRVYAIEQLRTADIARTLAAANGFGDRIVLVEQSSLSAELPERADVLVTETLWHFGLGEGIGGFVIDARERFLAPDAAIIPRSLTMILAPVEAPARYEQIEAACDPWHGLDLTAFRGYAVNNVHGMEFGADALAAAPQPAASLDLMSATAPDIAGDVCFVASRAAVVHGLAGWFECELAPGVHLSNAPPNPTCWRHAFFPLERPLEVEPGMQLSATIRSSANGEMWSWGMTADGAARIAQSTLWGFPIGSPVPGEPDARKNGAPGAVHQP